MGIHCCKGKCHLISGYIKRKKIPFGFDNGLVRCSKCECYFKTALAICGCCGTRMQHKIRRTSPIRIEIN